jgi:hypothetical protein
LKCPYCGHVEEIAPDKRELNEQSLDDYLEKQSGAGVVEGLKHEVKCSTCAAVVLVQDKIASDRCPYCGTFLENKVEPAQPMVPPEGVLPFAIDHRRAVQAFGAWLDGLWFAPRALRRFADLGRLIGLYIPFWTFDSMTYTSYQGQRGDDYQETEYYTELETYTDSDGQAQTRQVTKSRLVTKTRWTFVSGEVQHFFDDVLVCASSSLPDRFALILKREELQHLQPFRTEFVSGFTTERYRVGPKDGFEQARRIMDHEIQHLCILDIGGDHQRLESVATQHVGVTFKHVLLPVWLASYRFSGRVYQFMVDGRSGQVIGDRPYSWMKIAALVVGVVAAVAAVAATFWWLTNR